MISADVKATQIKTTRNKRSGGFILQIFKRCYVLNLKYNIKQVHTFHLILVGILSIFDIVH